jgi:hypothetical protein
MKVAVNVLRFSHLAAFCTWLLVGSAFGQGAAASNPTSSVSGGTTTGNPRFDVSLSLPTNVAGIRALPADIRTFALQDAGAPPLQDKFRRLTLGKRRIFPDLVVNGDVFHVPAHIKATIQPQDTSIKKFGSDNWSGFVITNPANVFSNMQTSVSGTFIEPSPRTGCEPGVGPGVYRSSQWVGIDGWGSPDVLQAGTELVVQCGGWGITHYAWLEWFPNAEVAITNLPVSQGNTIDVNIDVIRAAPGHPVQYRFLISSNMTYVVLFLTPPPGTTLLGNSVEWIVEAPTVGTTIASITDYGVCPWIKATAYEPIPTGGIDYYRPSQVPSSSTVIEADLVDAKGNVLSSPTLYPNPNARTPDRPDSIIFQSLAYPHPK